MLSLVKEFILGTRKSSTRKTNRLLELESEKEY